MKKFLTFFGVGIGAGLLFWLLATQTILLDTMERKLGDGFFYLREPDAQELAQGTKNPYVSDAVRLMAIDNKSLGVLGKWPWYRDVHARYLKTVQKFSPAVVYFDIAFIQPEKMPPSLMNKLKDQQDKLQEIIAAFAEMDNSFASELRKYDNVFIDLFLIGERQPNSPYLDRIIKTEEFVKKFSVPAAGDETILYKSLEPLVESFMENAQPVTVNQWPDRDGVIRNFLAAHSYETFGNDKQQLFSVVLAMLMEFYGIDDINSVSIEPDRVVLRAARAPALDKNNQPMVSRGVDFAAIKERIEIPAGRQRYNNDLYNFLVNEYSYLHPEEADRKPDYPLHLLKRDSGKLELIRGREVFDAAVKLAAGKIDVVYYDEKDVVINTVRNYAGLPHFFPINFAGRQELLYHDPFSGRDETYYTNQTESYVDVLAVENLPAIPSLTDGKMPAAYDQQGLAEWFGEYVDQRNNTALVACQEKYGNLTTENVLRFARVDDPRNGRFILYKMYLDDVAALVEAGELPGFESLGEKLALYGEWLGTRGIEQEGEYHLTEQQVVMGLQNEYRKYFDRFYNKFVFTGAYSAGMADDIKLTPYGSMFGVNVVVNAFNTIVTSNQITRSSNLINTITIFSLCLFFAMIYGLLNIRINFYVFILSFAATFVVSFLLFANFNYILKTIPLVLANVAVFLSVSVIKVLTEEKDKKFLKSTFSQYISPALIDTMYENKTMPELGGSSDIITAYFTDIQGFSTFSEKLTAQQLVELLNEYLSEMTGILLDEKGTLDKYEGDAIVAFFGAPLRFEDHALRGCRAAVEMQARLHDLRKKWQQDKSEDDRNTKKLNPEEWEPGAKWPRIVYDMRMRIGVNTGEIVTGNMGSRTRMNYTMMGDAVNLTARLEAAAKQYGVFTIISEYTYKHEFEHGPGNIFKVSDFIEVRFLDNVAVVGKSEPVKVYELIAMRGELSEKDEKLIEIFSEGIRLYLEMKWDEAMSRFTEALALERFPEAKLNPAKIYIKRCEDYKVNPPVAAGESWDGVYRLSQK